MARHGPNSGLENSAAGFYKSACPGGGITKGGCDHPRKRENMFECLPREQKRNPRQMSPFKGLATRLATPRPFSHGVVSNRFERVYHN